MKSCFIFMLVGTLFLPLSALTWKKKPADIVKGVLGENITLQWEFSLVSANETFDFFLLLQNGDDMIKYSHDVGVVIYRAFTGSVGLAANATPAFVLINLRRSADQANFCCKVGIKRTQGSQGEIHKHCVKLELLVHPSIVKISRNQTLNESSDVTLSCTATGTPFPNVTWSKASSQDIKFNPGTSLPLRNISRNQDGLYWCTAENGVGKSTASVRIAVQYAPSITVPVKSYNITEGSELELVCAADGRPRPVVTWTKIGEPSSEVYPDEQKLIITNANRTEAGTYKCTATNGIGKEAAATIAVVIFYKPTATRLTLNVTGNAVIRSFPVTFHCSADSVPPSVLELRFKNTSLGHFINGKFTIDQVNAFDKGMYKCLASNSIGVGSPATLNLTVLVPPSVEYISNDTTATEGDTVKLFCNSTGNPRPNITWSFLNVSGERIIMTGETLTLSNVTRNQAGTYQCTASNNIMNLTTAYVNVTITYPPGIHSGPVSQTVNESKDLELFCNATGNPPPNITWFKAEHPSVQLAVGKVLKLTNISRTDSGVYQCRASNGIGNDALASANVTVNYKPTATRLSSNVFGNAGIRNYPVTFHCTADSVPPPVLELRFKNTSLGHFIDGKFTIDKVKSSDEGQYECVPRNIIGTGRKATLNMTVLVPPSIVYISPDTTVNETDDVKLFCNSTGNPYPNITWTFLKASDAGIIRTVETLTLSEVSRNQAGSYRCAAANGVMSPKTADVHLTIYYKPKIKDGPRSQITSWINHETSVTCEAEGVPTPDITWTQNGIAVSSIPSKPGVNELTFIPEGADDFGDYVCTAKNLLGSTKKIITIKELVAPEAPEILRIDPGFDNLEIYWLAVVSNPESPVLDYLVRVEGKDESENWKNCTEVQRRGSSLMCVVNDLKSGSVYVVQVAAWNVVGYSAFTETEAQTKKRAVKGTADAQKQELLSRGTIDGIIAGVICFCSLVVLIVAIVTQRRPCGIGCNKDKIDKSSEDYNNEHENPAMEWNPENDQLEEEV